VFHVQLPAPVHPRARAQPRGLQHPYTPIHRVIEENAIEDAAIDNQTPRGRIDTDL
jgi:hypothetical protein